MAQRPGCRVSIDRKTGQGTATFAIPKVICPMPVWAYTPPLVTTPKAITPAPMKVNIVGRSVELVVVPIQLRAAQRGTNATPCSTRTRRVVRLDGVEGIRVWDVGGVVVIGWSFFPCGARLRRRGDRDREDGRRSRRGDGPLRWRVQGCG